MMASKRCVNSAVQSIIAFDGIDANERLIVTNVFGTTHAQFGNCLVLAAVRKSWMRDLVPHGRAIGLIERTKVAGQLCQLRSASKIHILQIKRYAGGLHDQADKLLQHAEKLIKHAKGPLYPADKQAAESDNGSGEETSTCGSASFPEHGNSVVRQESELDGYYNGGIKLESAQLGKHTVRNIYRIVEEFPASKEIGYFKSTAGNDLSIDLEKISGSTIRIESWYQSQAVRLSPSENHELRGLICQHEVAPVQSSSFRIPDLH
ncbi:hypothetical protein DBV05_g12042 [Lasiodiplodia theobromae]|uniref:Uncharacterized protein n=1 Tax=Lasiodiplodia theobromae TaxID=45133 RepID=A0A5N5CVC6_9PEZI|nr:hypothetical protein DBV05_g12042 [Lasiodiplodia theobromae]